MRENLFIRYTGILFIYSEVFIYFFHPFYYLRPSILSPSYSRSSDPGSHSRVYPPPHYGSCLAFFIARRFQLFLPSSTRAELCLPTLGALSS